MMIYRYIDTYLLSNYILVGYKLKWKLLQNDCLTFHTLFIKYYNTLRDE